MAEVKLVVFMLLALRCWAAARKFSLQALLIEAKGSDAT